MASKTSSQISEGVPYGLIGSCSAIMMQQVEIRCDLNNSTVALNLNRLEGNAVTSF